MSNKIKNVTEKQEIEGTRGLVCPETDFYLQNVSSGTYVYRIKQFTGSC